MKECDKPNSHISSELHMMCVSYNNDRHPVTKTFTTLYPTTLHSTSLHLSTLQFFPSKLPPITLQYTSLYFTQLHFTALNYTLPKCTSLHFTILQQLHFTVFHYTSPNYTSLHFTTLHYTSPTTLHYPLIYLNPFTFPNHYATHNLITYNNFMPKFEILTAVYVDAFRDLKYHVMSLSMGARGGAVG